MNPDGTKSLPLLVLVLAPTGVTYGQQCNGYCTSTRSAEGFLVPVGTDADSARFSEFFWRTFRGYPPGCGNVQWDDQILDQLRDLVRAVPCWKTTSAGDDERHLLELDSERLAELTEGWVPVTTALGRGVLLFANCD